MAERMPQDPKKRKAYRMIGLLVVVFGVAVSWVILAEFLLDIERKYWLRFPLYFLAIIVYWVPAWGAIASQLENLPTRRDRLLRGSGCLLVALVVFMLVSLLLTIIFIN